MKLFLSYVISVQRHYNKTVVKNYKWAHLDDNFIQNSARKIGYGN